jgi:hypothetical protein
MYKESGKQIYFRLYDNKTVGLFTSSGVSNAMFTLGDNFNNKAAISIKDYSGILTQSTTYGKLYVKPKIVSNQAQSLYFLDGSGNTHDVIVNKYDTLDARGLYVDSNGNTFGGYLCPDRRDDIPLAYFNTAIGHRAISSITTGSGNVAFGSSIGSGLTTGNRNIAIGNSIFNNINGSTSNNIIIGFNGVGNNLNTNNNFMLGSSSNQVLLHGLMNDKHLMMPSGGRLSIKDFSNTDSLSFTTNTIEVIDSGGNNYPDNTLSFKFTGNNSANLLLLKHHVAPLNIVPTYATVSNNRPHAELNGDLRLLGAIRFNDGSSLSSSIFLNNIQVLSSGLSVATSGINTINDELLALNIEGICPITIPAPINSNTPTSGNIIIKNKEWGDIGTRLIINKDPTLVIHSGSYVMATRVNNEYRPMWVSAKDISCKCCGN